MTAQRQRRRGGKAFSPGMEGKALDQAGLIHLRQDGLWADGEERIGGSDQC
ncbi:hypothetical protein [Kyrpidia spormannii]|uniref:hypothetical protein n=1 Tax=Kyrpidia spormannii TaxID=2055160 RepID=UPI00130006F3|nr:hypothetical protein [Kyrpidia spormannii]